MNARDLREPVVKASRGAPVQGHEPDRRVCPDKACNVVGIRIPDPAVGTTRPGTGSNHVPERDPLLREAKDAFRIGKRGRDAEEFLHHRPETVPRVAIILAVGKGEYAGKTAKNEDKRLRSGHRRESAGDIRTMV
jgi:hypothetical protein